MQNMNQGNMHPESTGKKIASIRCLNPKLDDDKERLCNPYVVCVHHGTDLDGWTSAALVQRWAEENDLMPFFFPMNHDAPVCCREIIENFRPRYFIVADYSLTVKEYRELCDTRVECDVPFDFLWCDHHASAVRDWHKEAIFLDDEYAAFEQGDFLHRRLMPLVGDWHSQQEHHLNTKNLVLLGKQWAGCRLLHRMLFPDECMCPYFIFLADRYDVWDMSDKDVREDAEALQLACKIHDVRDPASPFWKEVIYPSQEKAHLRTNELVEEGKKYKVYQERMNAEVMSRLAFTVEWHGHTWLAANTLGNSQIADSAFVPSVHDGVLLFSCLGHGKKPWKVSMYSHDSLPEEKKASLDFSVIAKEYGGGGHPGACGFMCDWPPFLEKIDRC